MTLKDLARSLGLSPTTVSRALNGYPEVGEATRRRVQEAARAHNYRPNTRARSLATGRAMAIGHVIPLSTKHEMVNPVFADFISGAGEAYLRAGYDMVLTMTADADQAQVYRDLRARGSVDGVIVHGPRCDDPRIALLNEIGMPFVVHGRSTGASQPYSWVDVNNRRSFRRAADLLLDLGHRRIALLNGPEGMDFAIRREGGWRMALEARGVLPDPDLLRHGEMTESYGYRCCRQMLRLPDPPTAFLVASVIVAIGVRRAAEEAGMRLGRDLSVVTHDDVLSYILNGDDVPLFTATRSSVREAGRRAAEMLLARIAAPDAPPATDLMEAELMIGLSTGPAPRNGGGQTEAAPDRAKPEAASPAAPQPDTSRPAARPPALPGRR